MMLCHPLCSWEASEEPTSAEPQQTRQTMLKNDNLIIYSHSNWKKKKGTTKVFMENYEANTNSFVCIGHNLKTKNLTFLCMCSHVVPLYAFDAHNVWLWHTATANDVWYDQCQTWPFMITVPYSVTHPFPSPFYGNRAARTFLPQHLFCFTQTYRLEWFLRLVY